MLNSKSNTALIQKIAIALRTYTCVLSILRRIESFTQIPSPPKAAISGAMSRKARPSYGSTRHLFMCEPDPVALDLPQWSSGNLDSTWLQVEDQEVGNDSTVTPSLFRYSISRLIRMFHFFKQSTHWRHCINNRQRRLRNPYCWLQHQHALRISRENWFQSGPWHERRYGLCQRPSGS